MQRCLTLGISPTSTASWSQVDSASVALKARFGRSGARRTRNHLGLCLGQLSVVSMRGVSASLMPASGARTHCPPPRTGGISSLGGTMRLGNCTVTLREAMVADLYGTTDRGATPPSLRGEPRFHRASKGGLIFTGTVAPDGICELRITPSTSPPSSIQSSNRARQTPPPTSALWRVQENKASTRAGEVANGKRREVH